MFFITVSQKKFLLFVSQLFVSSLFNLKSTRVFVQFSIDFWINIINQLILYKNGKGFKQNHEAELYKIIRYLDPCNYFSSC